MARRPANSSRTKRSRELRTRQTKPESLIWTVLRAKRLAGLKFRRQHPIGPYFADFACVEKRIVIELDGGYHDFQYEKDRQRQRFLETEGWQVLRFGNDDVLADVEAVAISIARQIGVEPVFKGTPPPNPLPQEVRCIINSNRKLIARTSWGRGDSENATLIDRSALASATSIGALDQSKSRAEHYWASPPNPPGPISHICAQSFSVAPKA